MSCLPLLRYKLSAAYCPCLSLSPFHPQPRRSSGSEELLPPAWLLPVSSVPFLWFHPWCGPWQFPMPPHRCALLCSRLLCKSYSCCYPPLSGNDRCPESFSAAYSRMSRIFELRIPTGISSQRQAGFPMLPSSCQPYGVHLYLQGSERTFEFMYTDYAEGLYRCRACVFLSKHSDRSLSFRLFLFWGARNKGQGSIIFSTF